MKFLILILILNLMISTVYVQDVIKDGLINLSPKAPAKVNSDQSSALKSGKVTGIAKETLNSANKAESKSVEIVADSKNLDSSKSKSTLVDEAGNVLQPSASNLNIDKLETNIEDPLINLTGSERLDKSTTTKDDGYKPIIVRTHEGYIYVNPLAHSSSTFLINSPLILIVCILISKFL